MTNAAIRYLRDELRWLRVARDKALLEGEGPILDAQIEALDLEIEEVGAGITILNFVLSKKRRKPRSVPQVTHVRPADQLR